MKRQRNLADWIEREKAAVKLSEFVVDLWYNKSTELVLCRWRLFDRGIEAILRSHNEIKSTLESEISIHDTLKVAKSISKLNLAPSKIDLAILTNKWLAQKEQEESCDDFVAKELEAHVGPEKLTLKPKDVVLYGFGRIGRIATRMLIDKTGKGEQLRLKAIVLRGHLTNEEIRRRTELFRNDSIFGPFRGYVEEDYEHGGFVANGQFIKFISANNPEEIDYNQFGISDALLIDSTGVWRDSDGLKKHLMNTEISKVLLTAPGKKEIPNIVYGVNHLMHDTTKLEIISAASCTTNAIVPPLKIINDHYGIEYGHIETIHSYTNDQNLLDNYHKKYRRGRAASLNLVITETGAGEAVAKCLPELSNKLTGNAVRIPTPNGSLAILNLTLERPTSKEEVNHTLKYNSLHGNLVEQISFSESQELVSTDIIGETHPSIIDGAATIVSKNGQNLILYIWYDNEWGYTSQVIRLAKFITGVRRLLYY